MVSKGALKGIWSKERFPSSEKNNVEKRACYLCGSIMTNDLLPNHEETCLAKRQGDNEKLPPEERRPLPLKPGQNKVVEKTAHNTVPTPRRRMAICYLCGREFGSASIRIHEPQCLKKWITENEMLPSEQRRSVPKKPNLVYTSDGRVDCHATDESFWKSHLVQLVPCGKCGRTFNPDRVAVHERACKASQFKH